MLGRTHLARWIIGLSMALSASLLTPSTAAANGSSWPPVFTPNLNCPIAFLAAGESRTVSGITVTAILNSAVQGDNVNTFLHQSNTRIATTLTFSPGIAAFKLQTRNHADAPTPNGYETYTIVGFDSTSAIAFETKTITNLDTTTSYLPGGNAATEITGYITRLEIMYSYDTPVLDNARGSYLTLWLTCLGLSPSSQTLTGQVGTLLTPSPAMTPTGTVGAVTYTVSAGTLPAGLALDPTTGVISGIPTETSTSSVTITATGAHSGTATGNVTFNIAAAPLAWVDESLAGSATTGTSYSDGLSTSPAATFAVTSGALPPGLTLATDGSLTGTPTADGTYTFTVTATSVADPNATLTKSFTIEVVRPRPVEPLLPAVLPGATLAATTFTCDVGTFSDQPEFVDVSLVVAGQRQDTRRVTMPATPVSWPLESAWAGKTVTCEVVAKVTNRVATAFAPAVTIPAAATPTPTTPVTPVTPVVPEEAGTPARGFAATSVRFDVLSARLDGADRRALNDLVREAGVRATYRVTGFVQGTRVTSNDASLSLARAQAVAAELRRLGVPASNITATGSGRSRLEGAAARRVTVVARWTR